MAIAQQYDLISLHVALAKTDNHNRKRSGPGTCGNCGNFGDCGGCGGCGQF